MASKPALPKSPTEALADRVVAWHNRHPLAERICLDQVQSIGVVAMPFAHCNDAVHTPPDATRHEPAAGRLAKLRQRLAEALRRLRRNRSPQSRPSAWQPVFSEDFLEPLRAAQVRPWAALYAAVNRPGDEQWSQRVVLTDPRLLPARPEPAPQEPQDARPAEEQKTEVGGVVMRYAATAALVLDHGRRRVLISTGKDAAVLGRRSWSVVRISMLTACLASMATVGATLPLWRPATPLPPGVAAVAPAAASLAAARTASAAPPPLPSSGSAALTATTAASAVHQGSASPHTLPGAPAGSAAGTVQIADATESASTPASATTAPDRARVGQSEVAAASTVHPDRPPTPSAPAARPPQAEQGSVATAPAAPAPASPATPAVPRGPVYALVSRGTQTETESRTALSRMAAAAAPLQERLPGTHTEVIRSGGRWAAVWWPFTSRDDATQARWALALKGVTVDLVEF